MMDGKEFNKLAEIAEHKSALVLGLEQAYWGAPTPTDLQNVKDQQEQLFNEKLIADADVIRCLNSLIADLGIDRKLLKKYL